MGFFRRNEKTLNEQLLEDAGLDAGPVEEPAEAPSEPEPADPYAGTYPADDAAGVWTRAMARPGEYDAVFSTRAEGIPGDVVEFATLPSGDIVVDTEQGDADLSPLADAVEQHGVEVPYRVVARRSAGHLWSIAARGIDVLELDFDAGDEIELASYDGNLDIRVDGKPWNGAVPGLEQAGAAAQGADYVVQAERLDGNLWEIRASPL